MKVPGNWDFFKIWKAEFKERDPKYQSMLESKQVKDTGFPRVKPFLKHKHSIFIEPYVYTSFQVTIHQYSIVLYFKIAKILLTW